MFLEFVDDEFFAGDALGGVGDVAEDAEVGGFLGLELGEDLVALVDQP